MLDLAKCRELLMEHDIELSDESLRALRLQLYAIATYVLDSLPTEATEAGKSTARRGTP
jgi:hypothetical protein